MYKGMQRVSESKVKDVLFCIMYRDAVEPVFSGQSNIDKTKIFKTIGTLVHYADPWWNKSQFVAFHISLKLSEKKTFFLFLNILNNLEKRILQK